MDHPGAPGPAVIGDGSDSTGIDLEMGVLALPLLGQLERYRSARCRTPQYSHIGRWMPRANASSTMLLIGAKPVAPATKTIGWALSRSVNSPSGPSKRSVSPDLLPA